MSDQERDDIPMLLRNVELPRFPRSTSMCMPVRDDDYEEDTYVAHTGPLSSQPPAQTAAAGNPFIGRRTPDRPPRHPQVKPVSKPHAVMPEEAGVNRWSHTGDVPKNEHLMMSGPLGQCDNPDCVQCPPACKNKRYFQRAPNHIDNKLHNILYGHHRGWKKSIERFLSYIPIMNPHAKIVQHWNQFFVISCLVAIFIDPLFFFLLSVQKDNKCIVLNWKFATGLAVVRSVSDAIYFLHMLLQFRLAYVAPESRVVGAGDLVDEPKKIAVHYLRGHFLLDFFVVLPLPQVMILVVIPRYVGLSTADIAKNYLRVTILLQYVPRIIRFVPLLGGRQSATGFIFESAWANFVINLLMFVMAGHVVGSCWYLFGLQVRLFTLMDWPILDAICDKLRQKLYISGSDILYQGGPVDKMVFIVRGKLESISADGIRAPLHDGDVCGEEFLTWYLEHSSANKGMNRPAGGPLLQRLSKLHGSIVRGD